MTETYVIPISCRTVRRIGNYLRLVSGMAGLLIAGFVLGLTLYYSLNFWSRNTSEATLSIILFVCVVLLVVIEIIRYCNIEFTCNKEGRQ